MTTTMGEQGLAGLRLLEPERFRDHRGFFFESYSRRTFAGLGLDLTFVQDNHSRSAQGVIRGLHYQGAGAPQWRLIRCTAGEVYDVVVDLLVGSPTFGRWAGFHLSADNAHQLLVPPWFAHGFAALSAQPAEVQYKCSGLHDPAAERSLDHADPDLGIAWPFAAPITSLKDAAAPSWQDYLRAPDFGEGWDR